MDTSLGGKMEIKIKFYIERIIFATFKILKKNFLHLSFLPVPYGHTLTFSKKRRRKKKKKKKKKKCTNKHV